jgi:hypothetical protein
VLCRRGGLVRVDVQARARWRARTAMCSVEGELVDEAAVWPKPATAQPARQAPPPPATPPPSPLAASLSCDVERNATASEPFIQVTDAVASVSRVSGDQFRRVRTSRLRCLLLGSLLLICWPPRRSAVSGRAEGRGRRPADDPQSASRRGESACHARRERPASRVRGGTEGCWCYQCRAAASAVGALRAAPKKAMWRGTRADCTAAPR